ncbi:transposase, IS4 family [Rubrobacter xylanophilus DSM 9941]|uniref:Transposase, IS4 family n=1 Tax=Rubrobacter xylanophilus (strain DSM 9941 / JCM 11954 / NBRC 16129 / PRD-1) TaxID=266117 RepID=Q1ATR2_RUBXD|nr:IS1182-like element ISRxy1 family transposase [Rubrobacter xylanophilus]ABG05216.1 transposase, IS4 family [Rubrobacter xylanophilus DSM 9941]
MLGRQSDLAGGGHPYLDHVRRDSFYGFLALHRQELFSDEDFAEFYCPDNRRPSVPPSLLATALLLQAYEGVSDEEAKARADFDLRWKVALGVGLKERPFAKSTLQLLRARLIINERMRTVFRRSLDFARHTGYLPSRRLKVVLDTSYVLGRGAVKDTYNLLADGIVMLVRELAAGACSDPEQWARERGLGRYFGSSLKGEAGIDWDDPEARQAFLEGVVADADRLLKVAREAVEGSTAGDPELRCGRLRDAALLLERLLMQDIERREDGARLKQGVSPDRVVSVHDPEMRHGRKSERRRFDGHKAQVAVDPESQLITAADVLAGNAPDHERALELVEQVEANADAVVEEVVGDCAYGDGDTRKTFAEAGRRLVAKVATRRGVTQFPKEDFRIDLEEMSCACPAGQKTRKVVSISSGDRYGAPGVPLRAFRFDAAICDVCPLRSSCVRAHVGKGRLVMIHPQEALLQEARAFQRSEAFAPYRELRQAAEHRLARLMQLGVRQARYFGRTKTLFQLLMAATVANLTLVATRVGLMRDRNHPQTIISIHVHALFMVRRVFATLSPRSEPGFSATLLEVL